MSDSESDISTLEEQLWEASRRGDLATVTKLCQRGVNPDGYFCERTSFTVACDHCHSDVVSALIQYSANVNVKYRVLDLSNFWGYEEILSVLSEHHGNEKCVFAVCADRILMTAVRRFRYPLRSRRLTVTLGRDH